MPPNPAARAGCGSGERLPAVPAALRDDHHHLIHFLDRQQPTEGPTVSWRSASLAARGLSWSFPRGLGQVGGWGAGGVGGVLAQPRFQLADALLQDSVLRAERGVLLPERRHLLQ